MVYCKWLKINEHRKGLLLTAFPEACMCTRLSLVLLSKLRPTLWESILSLFWSFLYRFLVKLDITSSLILTWISEEYCNFSHTSLSNTANAQGLAPDFHAGQGLNSAFKLNFKYYLNAFESQIPEKWEDHCVACFYCQSLCRWAPCDTTLKYVDLFAVHCLYMSKPSYDEIW